MPRPELTLCLIARNEENNVDQLFRSIEGCFDKVVFVDTGSSDSTLEKVKAWEQRIPVQIEHFAWVKDFSKARNYAFGFVKTKFAMWLDLDDVLEGREAFIQWRNHAMEYADFWIANYDYALNPDGSAATTFVRERCFNMEKGYKFEYFIHEGVKPVAGTRMNMITTWRVKHMRTGDDIAKDRSRNIEILEEKKHELDPRLTFYYGKELFEAGQFERAAQVLVAVISDPKLEAHDRILGIQYAAYSYISQADKLLPEHRAEPFARARQLAHQGLEVDPTRAEFYHILGDSFAKCGQYYQALPYYAAAQHCNHLPPGQKVSSPIFSFAPLYGELALVNQSKCYLGVGKIEESEAKAKEAFEKFNSAEAHKIISEIEKMKPKLMIMSGKEKTEDILITCPAMTLYPFDEEIYKTKGLGGSETALVQVAKALRQKTGRKVLVYNMRESRLVADSGVEYLPASQLADYCEKYEPAVHIAWRHNMKVTNALTYLWCHDLFTQGCELVQNFDYILCLTPFHADYVHALQGIPREKIIVTSNGIDPEKFNFEKKTKNSNKVVWMSSPDRGLDRCIGVMDLVKEVKPDLELHVYYGLENLEKSGPEMKVLADRLRAMMKERPWITYHGFTEQNKMYREVSDACFWLHPCDFIETFCITAIEMLALGVYPITRSLGGLQDTLREASDLGMATMLDCDCTTPLEFQKYAGALLRAIDLKSYELVNINPESYSWAKVAEDWTSFMKLEKVPLLPKSEVMIASPDTHPVDASV